MATNSVFARTIITLSLAALVGLLASCSSSDDPTRDSGGDTSGGVDAAGPSGPQPYGSACTRPEDCSSKLCVDGFCSKLCKRLSDCEPVRSDPDPKKAAGTLGGPCKEDQTCAKGLACYLGKECLRAFDCGRVEPTTIGCYPQQYDARPYTTGHDCSLDGVCAQSYKCMGQKSTADRFCSPACTSDKECPPAYRCAGLLSYGGASDHRCMPRKMGHPCDIDDQCGGAVAGELGCVKDGSGNGYCSKTCSKSDPGTCPPFAKCEDAGNGRLMCKYKAGFAYADGGKLCDPCIFHGESDGDNLVEDKGCAAGGLCFVLSPYTTESSCMTACGAEDACPESYRCFDVTLSPTDKRKLCAPIKQIPGAPAGTVTLAPCYPPPETTP